MSQLLTIHGPEQSLVDESLADAGLPPAVGVKSYCVFRASKDVPEITDGRGWTYHHHVDMACWRGRLYVGWNSCERDEDIWPARELYSTSLHGIEWTPPAEMFPQGLSTCLRMYFYHAPNGRMLVIAGLRSTSKTNEDTKGALIVREIHADHSFGDVFTLQPPTGSIRRPAMFEESRDSGFVEACRALLADTTYLEQQDRGRLLGPRRMKWHDAAAWPGGKVPGDSDKWVAGKAFSFFKRPDGALVAVSKMGWTTISFDDGKTWQQPEVPPTLVTGKAKVWSQRTADGRYALVYNPSRRNRFPLIVTTSDDGVNFRDMRIVQGELPIQRYAGADRSIGPQYTRGISHWANDGSRTENVMWLVYSMSKEDIWVSRVPLPVRAETGDISKVQDGWNLYVPKWASIRFEDSGLRIENRDPYDYAAATRVFAECTNARISFTVRPLQADRGVLDIDVASKFGAKGPVRLSFIAGGKIAVCGGDKYVPVGSYRADEPVNVTIDANATAAKWDLTLASSTSTERSTHAFAEPAKDLHRIIFRTGEFRGIGGKKPVEAGTDRPTEPRAYVVSDVNVARASGR